MFNMFNKAGVNRRLEIIEEKTSEFEDRAIKICPKWIIQKKNEQRIHGASCRAMYRG